jgi:hypothetical protein
MTAMKYVSLLLIVAVAFSCQPDRTEAPSNITAYVPVYASRQVVNSIGVEAVKPTVHAGKIYAYNNYLFQVEQNEGIHIIDNSNPQQAHKIAFLKVPMSSEIAIKSGYLYTNNLNDMVVFDLSNVSSPQLVKRVADAFPVIDQSFPPAAHGYFECADPSKGIVIGWEKKIVSEPKCRR